MPYKTARKRFGYFAIKRGFITEDQFIKAMRFQISNEQKGFDTVPIGEIMKKMGFMTDQQVEEVLACSLEFERYKCPNCGVVGDTFSRVWGGADYAVEDLVCDTCSRHERTRRDDTGIAIQVLTGGVAQVVAVDVVAAVDIWQERVALILEDNE